jgi:small subunit ribosomal protein S2
MASRLPGAVLSAPRRVVAHESSARCARSASTSATGLEGLDPYIKGDAGYRARKPYMSYVDTVRAEQLLAAKVHLGHQARRTNPHVTGHLYGFRHNIAIFDINKTWRSMRTLFYAFAEMAAQRSTFFLLAPNPNLPGLSRLIEKMKKEYPFRHDRFSSLYMNGYSDKKWIDGTFSNWKVTVEYARSVREVLAEKPSLAKYKKLQRYLKGVEDLDVFARIHPDFVLVLATDRGALDEIRNADLPMVGIVDSDTDPRPFLYPVFANNDAMESIQFIMDLIKRGVEEGRKREQEQFALLLIRKIKQYLDPESGTGAALIEPAEDKDDEDLAKMRAVADAASWLPPHPLTTYAERPEWLNTVGGNGFIKLPKA